MNKGNSVLRLHLAEEEPKPNVTPPDVAMGLKYWREINAHPNRWARFSASQFTHTRVVSVVWGNVCSDGSKEHALQTIIFTMVGNEVYVTKHPHF